MSRFVNNLTEGLYGVEGTVFSRLFDENINIISRNCSEEYVERCGEWFAELPEELITKLLSATLAYALDYVEQYGLDDPDVDWDITENSPVSDILKHIYPVSIHIKAPKDITEDDAPPAFDMEFSCEWELEHGLEWVVRGEDALYVGSFEGSSPWDFFGDEDWNYINRI